MIRGSFRAHQQWNRTNANQLQPIPDVGGPDTIVGAPSKITASREESPIRPVFECHVAMALALLNERRMRLVLVFVMLLACARLGAPHAVDGEQVPTPLIKAVYLLNFARFTEWPAASAEGPLTLCVL